MIRYATFAMILVVGLCLATTAVAQSIEWPDVSTPPTIERSGQQDSAFNSLLFGAHRGWANQGDGSISASRALRYTHEQLQGGQGRRQTHQLFGAGALVLVRDAAEKAPTGETTKGARKSKTCTTGGERTATTEKSSPVEVREVSVDDDETGLEFMRGICGEDAQMQDRPGAERRAACPSGCPTESPHPERTPVLYRAYVGDFHGDQQQYAVLTVRGCGGSGAGNQYGIFLLRKTNDSWEQHGRYEHGPDTRDCTVHRGADRDRLLCITSFEHSGMELNRLEVHSVEADALHSQRLMDQADLFDNRWACGVLDISLEGVFRRRVTTRVVADLTGDGKTEIGVGIASESGRLRRDSEPMEEDSVETICDEDNYFFETTRELRIWTLESDGFQRARELERTVTHPELLRYREEE